MRVELIVNMIIAAKSSVVDTDRTPRYLSDKPLSTDLHKVANIHFGNLLELKNIKVNKFDFKLHKC